MAKKKEQKRVLKIACKGADEIDYKKLNRMQGNLKTMSPLARASLRGRIDKHGFSFPCAVWKEEETGTHWILDAHQRVEIVEEMDKEGIEIPPLPINWVYAKDRAEAMEKLAAAASQYGEISEEGLAGFMRISGINYADIVSNFRFPEVNMEAMRLKFFPQAQMNISHPDKAAEAPQEAAAQTLADRFIVPPFSVLDARQGYWRTRKEQWLNFGIKSEKGRMENLLKMSDTILQPDKAKRSVNKAVESSKEMIPNYYRLRDQGLTDEEIIAQHYASDTTMSKGTSIFDPVLCELVYRWFTAEGATVVDPFAGGSVRGIVAAKLGRHYRGVELRAEQVKANMEQGKEICGKDKAKPQWQCGDSTKIKSILPGVKADLIFSCPPYADLEVYSNDKADISNMPYEKFLAAYTKIIGAACSLLKNDRFAAWVIGDLREKNRAGFYRSFVADTIRAFEQAGLRLYNDAVLITPAGTLALRAGRQFSASRKLGKSHQNVLVFCKGDPWKAVASCGKLNPEDFELADALGLTGDVSKYGEEVTSVGGVQ